MKTYLLLPLVMFAAPAQASAPKHDEPPPTLGGIQSQNILEVKPDASSDANYLKQSNGERNRVQPGNNAPMYRDVQRGVEGFTNYPKDKYPEMGVLIQPPVQYPGSGYVTAGEAWREDGTHHQLQLVEEHRRQHDQTHVLMGEKHCGHGDSGSNALLRAAEDDHDPVFDAEPQALPHKVRRREDRGQDRSGRKWS